MSSPLSIYLSIDLGKMSPIGHWETIVSPSEIGSRPKSIYINRPRWRLWLLFCTEYVSIRIYAYLYASTVHNDAYDYFARNVYLYVSMRIYTHLPYTLTPMTMTISYGMGIYTHLCVSIRIYHPRWHLWLFCTKCVSIRFYRPRLTPMTILHGMRIYTHLCISIRIYRPHWHRGQISHGMRIYTHLWVSICIFISPLVLLVKWVCPKTGLWAPAWYKRPPMSVAGWGCCQTPPLSLWHGFYPGWWWFLVWGRRICTGPY